MIRNFGDHAANERTFLAWVRTGIAVIAFGFLIERFDLFLETLANTAMPEPSRHTWLAHATGLLGRYDGFALIIVGIAIILLASIRFVRTARLIDDPEPRLLQGVRAEIVISALVALLAAGYSIYLVVP